MSYNFKELTIFIFFTLLILISGIGLFLTSTFISFFIFYEFLLLPSFFILYNFAKTRKALEAAYLMFFWTQFGAMFIVITFVYIFFINQSIYFIQFYYINFSNVQSHLIILFLLIGFGVKFPIWPFYDWLPKAHVEASTNFSIFLSGVLVKLAFFGFYKCLFIFNIYFNLLFFYSILFIGLIDSSLKLYYQIDLKKLIAYATIVEMHWLTLSLLNGQTIFWIVSFSMLVSHAFLSSNFFFLIDSVTRRFKTRLLTEISFLNFLTPKLYFLILLMIITFLGFPGSLFFIAEFLFFSFLLDLNVLYTFVLLLILYFFVSSCYFKNWFFIMFGYSYFFSTKRLIIDLDFKEFLFISFILFFVYILGFFNQFFFN